MANSERKTALVTGGASGLGEAIVRRLSEGGMAVWLCDVDHTLGMRVAREIGETCRFFEMDVSSEADWIACFQAIEETDGRIDVLVNNAGISPFGNIESLSLDQFQQVLNIDLVGVFLGCKHVVPMMKRTGGSVINMSSRAGLRANADLVGYNAAKAGVTLLTQSVALHYGRSGYGMRCNSVHPGAILTPGVQSIIDESTDPEKLVTEWESLHPIGRLGRPEDVAALVWFLASDESSFVTGGAFTVDGGASL